MKIAVVTETFHPFKGGSAKRYHEVFKRIVRMGHDVELHTVKLRVDWPEEERVDGIRVFRSMPLENFITKTGFRDVMQVIRFTSWAFSSVLQNDGVDVVEANHCPIFPSMGSWFLSKLRSEPLCVTFHEAWHSEWYRYVPQRLLAPLGIALEGLTTRLPDVAIAVSEMTADRLMHLFGLAKGKIRVIPNGVDLQLFESVKAQRKRHRIVFVGRLNPHKKIEWLLGAFERIRDDFPDATLEVVGDGVMKSKLASKDGIVCRGPVDDMELVGALKSAWVYVLPSIREGQSITTLEAMAAGTPQIVVDAPGNAAAELIRLSGSGMVVAPSPKGIEYGLRTLLTRDDVWQELRSKGLEFVQKYDWERISEAYLSSYQSFL